MSNPQNPSETPEPARENPEPARQNPENRRETPDNPAPATPSPALNPSPHLASPPSPALSPLPAPTPRGARWRAKGTQAFGSGRLLALDIVRGLAVIGMMSAHLVHEVPAPWNILAGLAEGRSSALFALVAGVSIGILSGRSHPLDGVDLLQARMRIAIRAILLLIIVAFVSVFNVIVSLILGFYAFWFFFALPFLRLRTRGLLIWAAILATAGPLLSYPLRDLLTSTTNAGFDSDGLFFKVTLLGTYQGANYFSLILIGLAMARAGLLADRERARSVARKALGAGAIIGLLGIGGSTLAATLLYHNPGTVLDLDSFAVTEKIEESSSSASADPVFKDLQPEVFPPSAGSLAGKEVPSMCGCWDPDASGEATPDFDQPTWSQWLADKSREFLDGAILSGSPHSGSLLELWGNIGFTLCVLSLLVLSPRRFQLALFPLAAVGSMSLSVYSAHIPWVTLATVLSLPSFWAFVPCALFFLVAASFWRLFIGRGPLEKLLHWASTRGADITPRRTQPAPSPAPAANPTPPAQET